MDRARFDVVIRMLRQGNAHSVIAEGVMRTVAASAAEMLTCPAPCTCTCAEDQE